MNVVEPGFAFLAGMALIASPCVIMLLPVVLGTASGRGSRPVFIVLGFVAAFMGVALAFAKGVSLFGLPPTVLRQSGIVVLALFAAVLFSESLHARMGRMLRRVSDAGVQLVPAPGVGKTGGFVLGMSLGAVWTPCSGPVLASIVTVVSSSTDTGWGAVLLLAFATGTAIPMLLVAYGGKAVSTRLPALARNGLAVRRTFAVLTLIVAGFMQWQQSGSAAGWIANGFQSWI